MTDENMSTRSTFVTVLAWVFIVLAGFSTLITIMQNIMIRIMFSNAEMQKMMEQNRAEEQMPAFANFMIHHFDLFFLAAFIVSVLGLVAAIGLLKRKNWARIVFIVLLGLGIVWNIGGIILQQIMMHSMRANMNIPPDVQQQMHVMQSFMTVISVFFALAFSTLFGWIIWKLVSPDIRKEFGVNIPNL